MKFGLMLPNKGHPYGDVNLLVELALNAEQAGWEGFFLWDHIGGKGDSPTLDPWICHPPYNVQPCARQSTDHCKNEILG